MSVRFTMSRLHCIVVMGIFVMISTVIFSDAQTAGNANKGTITGKIMMKDGSPLSGGQVLFYNTSGLPPASDRYERIPDFVRDIAPDGSFLAELPEGTYSVGAVRRQSGERLGPARQGDIVWRGMDSDGRLKHYAVKAGGRTDIGTVSDAGPLKTDAAKGVVTTAIEGVIVDMNGKPVADAVVVAFPEPTVKSKPLFISDKTDASGQYRLRLAGGTYYLRARNQNTSGPPEPGQIIGYYGDGTATPVTVRDGEVLKNMNFRVILFPGRGPFSGTQPAR